MIINILIGLCSGIISGMGIGGGVLLIPMLVFFCGINQQNAQNINLIYFIPTAIISLITHKKNGNIENKYILKTVIAGLVGAFFGSIIANKIDGELLKRFFGVFLLIMGIFEFRKNTEKNWSEADAKS